MDLTVVLIIVQLIFLEGILSIDNAAVLGTMVSHLPDDKWIPWPKALSGFGAHMHKLLGHQRTAALRVGLLGAYLGRGLMLLVASVVVNNPWLKLLGAAYLIRLAFDNLGKGSESNHGGGGHQAISGKGFWGVVVAVELADLAFSLDNVVAAVAISDRLWVVMLGVAMGILFMRFAAGLFSIAVRKEPVLKTAAYILVLNIGVELLLAQLAHIEFGDWGRFGISIGTIVLSLVYARLPFLQTLLNPILNWLARGFYILNRLTDWVIEPIVAVIKLPFRLVRLVFPLSPAPERSQGD